MAQEPEPAILLLIKMLKMTSAEDNIALVAIRKANSLLAQEGWDWEKLLRGKVTIIGDPFGNLKTPPSHNPGFGQHHGSPSPPFRPQFARPTPPPPPTAPNPPRRPQPNFTPPQSHPAPQPKAQSKFTRSKRTTVNPNLQIDDII